MCTPSESVPAVAITGTLIAPEQATNWHENISIASFDVYFNRCASCGMARMSFDGPVEVRDCDECVKWLDQVDSFYLYSHHRLPCTICGRSKPAHPINGDNRMVEVFMTEDDPDETPDSVCSLCYSWANRFHGRPSFIVL